MSDVLWVSPDGERWKVQWEKGDLVGHHSTQTDAIAAARAFVHDEPTGTIRQIRVQRPDGTIREEWTYGTDPNPPAG